MKSAYDKHYTDWSPWAKGIREAVARTGTSLLECANRIGLDAERLERGITSSTHIKLLEEETGLSEADIRRIGLGLDP